MATKNTTEANTAAAAERLVYEKGLPSNTDAERLILGSLLLTASKDLFSDIEAMLDEGDFFLESHRRVWLAMKHLRELSEHADHVTLANELTRRGQLESVGGLSYLIDLQAGLPEISNLAAYARIVKEKSALRKLIDSAQVTIRSALTATQTADEVVAQWTDSVQSIQLARMTEDDGGRTPEQIVTEFPGGLSAFLDPTQRMRGIPTGFSRLDEMTGGFHPGELTIIAARPSMGKSTLGSNFVEYLCLAPRLRKHCAFFSFEMSKASLLTRMICSQGRIDQNKFRAGFLNKDDRERAQEALFNLTEARLDIYDDASLSFPRMASIIRRKVHDEGLHLVLIDYLQLIAAHNARSDGNRNLELSEISRGLKLLASELEIPIIALSQLSRASEKRPGSGRPQLSDIRDSGSIEQDADNVMFIYREEVYKRDRKDLQGLAELIIGKQRNGPIGTVRLRFIGSFLRFFNRTDIEEGSNED